MQRTPMFLLLFALAGCIQPASWHAGDADREVDRILLEGRRQVDAEQANTVRPKRGDGEARRFFGKKLLRVDLDRALELAVTWNRDYLSRKETLYRQGLSTSLTRFNFGPQLAAAVSYLWSDQETGSGLHAGGVVGSVRQILPTGGTLTLSGALSSDFKDGKGDDSYNSSVDLRLSQPLLRGAGYQASHEALTQSERDLIYSIRSFELFRQDFSIGLARDYYGLVSQQQTLANQERSYKESVYDRKKAQALRKVDRNTDEQVFRAQRREVETEAQLISARASYQRGLDQFKIRMGLPVSARVVIVPRAPPYEKVRLDPASAVKAAHKNRLDIKTSLQRVQDRERQVEIAANGLLPDLSLTLSGGYGATNKRLQKAWADEWTVSGGLTLNLPLQLKRERNTYRSALISRAQQRRAHRLLLDQVEVDVRDALRQLRSVERQIVLAVAQITLEKRAVTVTRIRYEAGVLDNRDLIEARTALINAQNALIRLKADHFVRRLTLLRTLGILSIDDKGKWR